MSSSRLAIPAVRQILSKMNKNDKEEEDLVEKIENSCIKFDHDKVGRLAPDEFFNVLKLQNSVDCSKEEVFKLWVSSYLLFLFVVFR